MDPVGRQERKREARHRIRAQRRRAGLLRSRVIVISLVSFALLWGTVFVQMATGNDPVLGDSSSTLTASQRSGSGGRSRRASRVIPVEAKARTDSEEAATAERTETTEPEPVEAEIAAPEPEPAPVTTSQS